ncbi:MAG: hypothetical protein RMA76_31850 [Deltaproteobacteria bacterium]|jgi:hypothetical protein
MALKDLDLETMVTVVGAWVGAQRDREVIEQYPKLAPFLPDLDALHDTMLSAGRPEPTDLPEELARVRAEIKELDRRHDDIVRGIDGVLAGLIDLAPKASTKATIESLRETLLPEGRRVVTWSMRRQGGAAERARSRLTPVQRKALREMKIPGGTLLGFFNERVTLARQLVELDQRRVALMAAIENAAPNVGKYDAALAFVRTVGLFVAIAEVSNLGDEDHHRLLGGLEAALENVDARRSAQADKAVEEAMDDLDASAKAQPADVS